MNLFSAADRLAAMDRSGVRLDASRCLHTLDRFSNCQACLQSCPVEALKPGKPPAFDGNACTRCLACLPVCPTGALQADDAMRSLLNCVPRLPAGGVELMCSNRPTPGPACPDSSILLRVRGCLAGLGPGSLVALVAAEAAPLRLRTDACASCAWSKLEQQIRDQVDAASRFLERWDKAGALSCTSGNTGETSNSIPIWDSDNPPLSRRDLFRLGSRQGSLALARAMNAESDNGAQKTPPRERRRLLGAATHLPPNLQGKPVLLEQLQWAYVSVSSECTACGVCARVCPTGAIRFDRDETNFNFRLSFHPEGCTDCKACTHSCAPGAIQLQSSPDFDRVFAQPEPVCLLEGGLKRCDRCNAWISAQYPSALCPVCQYRKKHPFGSTRPPGFGVDNLSVKKGPG